MRTVPSHKPAYRPGRHIQQMDKKVQGHEEKLAGPAICRVCHAMYRNGTWTWRDGKAFAEQVTCPACRRIEDGVAAAYVHAQGAFLAAHRDDILRLIRNVENREKAEHPMKRIMSITAEMDHVMVATTEVHLAHGIGEALKSAYQGRLEFRFDRGDGAAQVNWVR